MFAVFLYAISAVYFAGVMVRLKLTLTPVVCVLAAIAFSNIFDIKDETKKPTAEEIEEKEQNEKYYDKVSIPCLGFDRPCRGEFLHLRSKL